MHTALDYKCLPRVKTSWDGEWMDICIYSVMQHVVISTPVKLYYNKSKRRFKGKINEIILK